MVLLNCWIGLFTVLFIVVGFNLEQTDFDPGSVSPGEPGVSPPEPERNHPNRRVSLHAQSSANVS